MQAHPDIIRTLASLHERCSALESHLLNSQTHLAWGKNEKISIFKIEPFLCCSSFQWGTTCEQKLFKSQIARF